MAAGASALPEIGRCVAKEKGKYLDSNCTKKSSAKAPGSFEWEKNAVKKHFTVKNNPTGPTIELEGASGTKISCKTSTSSGEYFEKGATPSTKEVKKVVTTFTGCELPLFSAPCQTKGHPTGEIVTTSLKGILVYISGKKTPAVKVGTALSPEVKKKGFAEFECPAVGVVVYVGEGPEKGHETIIGEASPVNVSSTTSTQTFKGSKGVQEPQHKEGSAVIDNLESSLSGPKGTFERSNQILEATQTNEEALEIKA